MSVRHASPGGSARRLALLPEEPEHDEGKDDDSEDEHETASFLQRVTEPDGLTASLLSISILSSSNTSNQFL
jgi:hypothetical protein